MRSGISLATRFKLMQKAKFCCVYCGRSASEVSLEIDHVVPKSKGGTNSQDNLVVSCFECNRGKRDRALDGSAPQPREKLAPVREHGLVGKFFHTFAPDGCVQYQGHVLTQINDTYMVRLFEWFTGSSMSARLWTLKDFDGASFYDTAEEMRHHYEYHLRFALERQEA